MSARAFGQSFGGYSHRYERERPRDARCIVCGGTEEQHDKVEQTVGRVIARDVSRLVDEARDPVIAPDAEIHRSDVHGLETA